LQYCEEGLKKKDILHPTTTPSPVAIVEFEPFALEDEAAKPVLGFCNGNQAF